MKIRMRWVAVATVPVLASSGVLGVMLSGAGATTHHVARPDHARHGVRSLTATNGAPQVFHQEFSTNTKYFCVAGSGNAPCDGNGGAGDYGTIDRVASGFSNGGSGNYAPSTNTPGTDFGNWFALTSGAGAANQGVGCPADNPPGGENCTGPYALFPIVGGTGSSTFGTSNVFPTSGFTVTNELYLSPATAGPNGTLIDDDVELNNNAGTYGIDNIVGVCYNTTAGGFTINFSHNTGNCSYTSGTTPVITTPGWYRFVFVFSNVSGFAELTENVVPEGSTTPFASSGPQPVNGSSATPIGNWGGPGYFWLPDEDVSGLPVTNFALQDGQHTSGYTPT